MSRTRASAPAGGDLSRSPDRGNPSGRCPLGPPFVLTGEEPNPELGCSPRPVLRSGAPHLPLASPPHLTLRQLTCRHPGAPFLLTEKERGEAAAAARHSYCTSKGQRPHRGRRGPRKNQGFSQRLGRWKARQPRRLPRGKNESSEAGPNALARAGGFRRQEAAPTGWGRAMGREWWHGERRSAGPLLGRYSVPRNPHNRILV